MRNSISQVAAALSRRSERDREAPRASRDIFGTMRAVSGANDSVTYEVMLDGGDSYSPCTLMVGVHHGDRVLCHIVDHRIVVFANITVPSVNDGDYEHVKSVAEEADDLLDGVAVAAATADKTVAEILDDAVAASELLSDMQDAADQANTSLVGIFQDAEDAKANAAVALGSANAAQASADKAKRSASSANYSLSDVERVVGTLNWISEHGRYASQRGETFNHSKAYYTRSGEVYEPTQDSAIDSQKTYYTRSGSGTEQDPYAYEEVASPDVSDIATYYEVVDATYTLVAEPQEADIDDYYILIVDESVQNYIASHVYLTGDGLFVTNDASGGYRVRIDGDSIDVLDSDGILIASFGAETFIGAKDKPICVKLTGDGMVFYPIVNGEIDTENPIASFIVENGVGKLVVHNAVIMQELVFDNWKWMPRGNGNLALKWIGA